MTLAADCDPSYKGEVTFTSTYTVTYPIGGPKFEVRGFFDAVRPEFEYVSGDSSWVDSVLVNTPVSHSAVFRAMKHGQQDANVYVYSILEPNVVQIGGSGTITLNVK